VVTTRKFWIAAVGEVEPACGAVINKGECSMRIIRSLGFLVFGSALAFSGPSAAAGGPPESVSADYVEVADGVSSRGKFYASPEGIRFEGKTDGEAEITIVNFTRNVIWTFDEAERMYIEISFEPARAGDYTSPCADLKLNGELQHAKRIGHETLNGRKVEKWQCEGPKGVDTVWFDDRLKMELKSQDRDGETFELRNIKEGRVSGDLFQPLPGYTRMAMPAMPAMSSGRGQPRGGMPPGQMPDSSGGGKGDDSLFEGLRGLLGR
jgi:hypothetical protein